MVLIIDNHKNNWYRMTLKKVTFSLLLFLLFFLGRPFQWDNEQIPCNMMYLYTTFRGPTLPEHKIGVVFLFLKNFAASRVDCIIFYVLFTTDTDILI